MNIFSTNRIKIGFLFIVLLCVVFSSFPSFPVARASGCNPNFTTEPMVAGGVDHTVVLKSDGTVWAWGGNHYGQLGDGSNVTRSTPAQVSLLCEITAIAAGTYYTLALKSDGTVWAWGENMFGKLGIGTTQASSVPVKLDALSNIVAIAAGKAHAGAVTSGGEVWMWGNNYSGALGHEPNNINGYPELSLVPQQVSGLTDVKSLSLSSGDEFNSHTVALKKDGTVWTWGYNGQGQLGYTSPNYSYMPKQVKNLDGTFVAVKAGGYYTVALKDDGTVWAWGINNGGELGDGKVNATRSTPEKVLEGLNPDTPLPNVKAISAGYDHTVALLNDGTLRGWGANFRGELGDETRTTRFVATKPMKNNKPLESTFVSIGTGTDHTIALEADGTVWTWGFNGDYQLGNELKLPDSPYYYNNVPNPVMGFNAITKNPTLQLTGAAKLIFPEWSTAPATFTAYVNNPGNKLTDIKLELLSAPGLTLADGSAIQYIDHIDSGATATATWKLKPATAGTYQITVNAYRDGDSTPFAQASFQFEALASKSPELTLYGRQLLYYPDWLKPTYFSAYLYSPESLLTNVRLEMVPGPGVTVVDGALNQTFDRIFPDENGVARWNLNLTEGDHTLTVKAYQEGSPEPIAEASYLIKALPPITPANAPNVTLTGAVGYSSDGKKLVAGSSLGIVVDEPCIPGSKMIATDASGQNGYSDYLRSPIPGAAWSVLFNPFYSGTIMDSPVTIKILGCGNELSFDIELIDPSGIVYNAEKAGPENPEKWPLPDATVVLQYFDPAVGEWVDMSAEKYAENFKPLSNPQITGEDGRYAWDTAEGDYRVAVSRPGFEVNTSEAVHVPPPVTDLHIGLTPTDRTPPILILTGATDGETYTQPVTLQYYAFDDESGVRYVESQLDGGKVERQSDDYGSILVRAPGSHTLDFTVVDHAGNIFTKQLSFTINEQPIENRAADLNALIVSSSVLNPSFASGTTSYTANVANSVSSVTVTASVYDPANATVTASVYNGSGKLVSGPLRLTSGAVSPSLPLRTGKNVIEVVVTAMDSTTKTYTVVVTRAANPTGNPGSPSSSGPGSSDGTGSGSSGDSPGGGTDGASDGTTWLRMLINGREYEQIAAANASEVDGTTVYTITIDTASLEAQLANAGQNPVIVIPVTASADRVTVVMSGDAVKALENKQAVLEIRTPNGSYTLPAAEIQIDSLSEQLGKDRKLADIALHVDIAKGDRAQVGLLENTAESERFTVVVPPVEFAIGASSGGKTVNADKFGSYIKREIPLPVGAGPSSITTAVALEADGTVRHVPTYVVSRDGKYYAVFRSLTNSAYALIRRSVAFADVEGHWARLAVNDLASRNVINGIDETHFRPDAAVTRAEFAAILVRALGLNDKGNTSPFTDVNPGDWFVGAVAKAQEYGIVEGYTDGTFRPDKTITRQEAMVMIARAMKLAGLETNIGAVDVDVELSRFPDSATIGAWARDAIAAAVKSGIVGGSNAGLLPTNDITRAETAVIVQRMLEKANLIGGSL